MYNFEELRFGESVLFKIITNLLTAILLFLLVSFRTKITKFATI
ncbi:hypothetical protein JCM19298_2785 [Nonlabens ulvanivorans]|nr:hypothetical protein JCM19298_2785 [Nonlabens ulvanivorans]